MACNKGWIRFGFVSSLLVGAALSRAIVFSNIFVGSPPMSDGHSIEIVGNSISFVTPNAIVGDAVDPIRAGQLSIIFDAENEIELASDLVRISLAAFTVGSGRIDFSERVFELDENGNELGMIGQTSHTFLPGGGTNWQRTIVFDHPVRFLRVKKDFILTAPATEATDLAALGIINQSFNVVPEPASLAVLGLGAAALLRRRRK